MKLIANRAPHDAIVWAWWDYGYTVNFWSRRATVNDGSIHSGERTVYNGIPFATHSFRLSANFMKFYATRGLVGMDQVHEAVGGNHARGLDLVKRILAAGPQEACEIVRDAGLSPVGRWRSTDDWLHFFFPRNPRPVYVLMDAGFAEMSYWWYWFGTWDIREKTGHHPRSETFGGLRKEDGQILGPAGLRIDPETGILQFRDRQIRLSRLSVFDGKTHDIERYQASERGAFSYIAPEGTGVWLGSRLANSVFGRLFFEGETPNTYFVPVVQRFPLCQLWRVEGDNLPMR